MTVEALNHQATVRYSRNVARKYNIPFKFLENKKNIRVYLRNGDYSETDLILDDDYDIEILDGTNNVWGTVDVKIGIPTDIKFICICRDIASDQNKQFSSQTVFSTTTETALDKLTMLVQDNMFKDYAIHAPNDDIAVDQKGKSVMQLPPASERAGKFVAFDEAGNVTVKGEASVDKSLRQDISEQPDESFILQKAERINKIVSFDEEGSVKYLEPDGKTLAFEEIHIENGRPKRAILKGNYKAGRGINISPIDGQSENDIYISVPGAAKEGEGYAVFKAHLKKDKWIKEWIPQISGVTTNLESVTYGKVDEKGMFVAVGPNATILTSVDGETWGKVLDLDQRFSFYGVTYGKVDEKGMFVAVGFGEVILTSDNGTKWNQQRLDENYILESVTYGKVDEKGMFVAVGFGGVILTSDNGTKWNQQESHENYTLDSVTYGKVDEKGMFVAVGFGGVILTSDNGTVWMPKESHENYTLDSVTYGKVNEKGMFVAVGPNATILTSVDGETWDKVRDLDQRFSFYGVTYGKVDEKGMFVAVGSGGVILTSDNGTEWNQFGEVKSDLYSITHEAVNGKGKFVAVGKDGVIFFCDTSYFIQTVDTIDILKEDVAVVDVVLSEDKTIARQEIAEWSKVSRIDTNDGTITAFCFDEIPTVDLEIQLKV